MNMIKSPLLIAALVLGGLAILLHSLGVATSYWIKDPTSHHGLWSGCRIWLGMTSCFDIASDNLPAKFQVARAFSIIGALAGAAALGLILLYMFVKHLKLILILATAAAGGAAVSVIISFATFIAFFQPEVDAGAEYSWSFDLCIAASVLFIAQMVVLLVNVIKSDRALSDVQRINVA